jgi:hypothetical protein
MNGEKEAMRVSLSSTYTHGLAMPAMASVSALTVKKIATNPTVCNDISEQCA